MTDHLLLEEDSGDTIGTEDGLDTLTGESVLLGSSFKLYPPDPVLLTAEPIGNATRTFILTSGHDKSDARRVFNYHVDALNIERGDQSTLPVFQEMFTPLEMDEIKGLPPADIDTRLTDRLNLLQFDETVDQILYFGEVNVVFSLLQVVATYVASEYRVIRLDRMHFPQEVPAS